MHFVWLARSGHVTVPAHQQMRHTGITHIITPSTTATTHPHPTPLPPSHYHRQPVALVQERATQRPRNAEMAPKRHQDSPADSSTMTQNEESATRRKCDGHDGTHKGGPGGVKGAWASNGQGVQGTPAFFSFFFRVYSHPPPLLAPPPPSPPPNHKEHTYKGVFFVFGKFSTPPPSRNTKNAPEMARFSCFVFRR